MKRSFSTVLLIVGLAAVYFGAGLFGLTLAFSNKSISAVWPPTGISLAAILILGYRVWPGIFAGAFLANYFTNGSAGVSFGIALGNSLEALLGGWLVNKYAGGRMAFAGTGNILRFFLLAPLASTLISAAIGPTALCLGNKGEWSHFALDWLTWWVGDGVSEIVLAPLLVIWSAGPRPKWRPSQTGEMLLLLASILLAGGIVFGGWLPRSQNYPIEYLTVPPLLWAGWRFGLRGASAAALLTSAIAVVGTLHEYGPFGQRPHTHNEALLLMQAFIATLTVTAIVLASIVAERHRMDSELQSAQRQLEAHARDLERKVAERTARLQEAVSDLEAFSYTVSHDLRAPLRAMRQYSDVLLKEHAGEIDQRTSEILHRIAAASERLDALIIDVLDYSRVVRSEIDLKAVDVERLTRDIIHGYPHLHHFESAITVASPLLPVLGNEIFLTQCLSNLLGNAVKFARPDTPIKVRVWTEPRGSRVAVCVEDNGIGIDPQYHSRIFGLFERLHSDSEFAGTGMGLAIVRRATDRMGGCIGFESSPGVGTRFWMELRAANPPA